MRPFEHLLKESASIHGHLCAGQVLGVRMAMVGCREAGIDEPKGSKKLIVYVEMDRCATDAIQAVTGCSLGKRSLKFLDYGKMAATFVNLETGKAVRVLARDDARSLVCHYADNNLSRHEAERQAYTVMPEEALFCVQPATVEIPEEDMPGARGSRVLCEKCGEGINFGREIEIDGKTLCIPCARGSYLPRKSKEPPVVLVVGPRKSGKTTLIEKLVPELSARGYRVGTVKHHHSGSRMEVDAEGKDSWRHRRAGAKAVALVSPIETAIFRDTDSPTSLDDLVAHLNGVDIILVEGFRLENRPRIEIRRTADSPAPTDENLLALLCPERLSGGMPCWRPEEIGSLVDLIEKRFRMERSPGCTGAHEPRRDIPGSS